MKKVLLLGTEHPIQRGKKKKDIFKFYLKELCITHEVKAIAEEIDDNDRYIAENLSSDLNIKYKIIEPTRGERSDLGIEDRNDVICELMERNKITKWPDKSSADKQSLEIHKECDVRMQIAYRQREFEWLKRINELDTWPVLIICGAEHYEFFDDLLVSSGIVVVKEESKWGL